MVTGTDNTCTGWKSEMAIWSILSALLGWKDGHFGIMIRAVKNMIGELFMEFSDNEEAFMEL